MTRFRDEDDTNDPDASEAGSKVRRDSPELVALRDLLWTTLERTGLELKKAQHAQMHRKKDEDLRRYVGRLANAHAELSRTHAFCYANCLAATYDELGAVIDKALDEAARLTVIPPRKKPDLATHAATDQDEPEKDSSPIIKPFGSDA